MTCWVRIKQTEWVGVKLVSHGGLPRFLTTAGSSHEEQQRVVLWTGKVERDKIGPWGTYKVEESSKGSGYEFGDENSIWAYNAGKYEIEFLNFGMFSQPGTQEDEARTTTTVRLWGAVLQSGSWGKYFEPAVSPGAGSTYMSHPLLKGGSPTQAIPVFWDEDNSGRGEF